MIEFYNEILIKQGAAVEDGRLRPGDRLLRVNDIEMMGKTQPEAVAILRQAPTGSIVKISVSRQEDIHHKEVSLHFYKKFLIFYINFWYTFKSCFSFNFFNFFLIAEKYKGF